MFKFAKSVKVFVKKQFYDQNRSTTAIIGRFVKISPQKIFLKKNVVFYNCYELLCNLVSFLMKKYFPKNLKFCTFFPYLALNFTQNR